MISIAAAIPMESPEILIREKPLLRKRFLHATLKKFLIINSFFWFTNTFHHAADK
jgi:hypothetical protein